MAILASLESQDCLATFRMFMFRLGQKQFHISSYNPELPIRSSVETLAKDDDFEIVSGSEQDRAGGCPKTVASFDSAPLCTNCKLKRTSRMISLLMQ